MLQAGRRVGVRTGSILVLVGSKNLVQEPIDKTSPEVSLAVVATLLTGSIITSLLGDAEGSGRYRA